MDLKQETINYIKNIGKVMNENEEIEIDDLINTKDCYDDDAFTVDAIIFCILNRCLFLCLSRTC